MGQWKTLFEQKEKLANMECVSLKMQAYSDKNATIAHVLTGQILTGMTGDEQDDFYSNDKDINVFFDDDVYFTFNHQIEPSKAAI